MQKTQPMAGPAAAPAAPAPPFNLAGTILLAAMATAMVALFEGVAARVYPQWGPGPLAAACFLVSVEAALVRYRMREGRHVNVGSLPYLAAELFAVVVLMRVVATLSLGLAALPAQAELWLRSPLSAIDPPFIGCLVIGLACAVWVRLGLRELSSLEAQAAPFKTEYALDAEIFRAHAEADERDAVSRLATGITWGGLLVIVALVAQLADLRAWGGTAGALPPTLGLAGIVYLACGVLLYSRARLSLLRARWRRDEATVEPLVARRWRWQSVALVLAIVAVGLLLPRSYGAGLVDAVRTAAAAAINLLGLAALALGLLALGALGIALTIPAFLLSLLGLFARTPAPTAPVVPVRPPPPPPPPAVGEPPLAPGIVFWICIGLLALYAVWTVLKRQAWAVAAFERLRAGVLAPLAAWLQRLWGGATGYARLVGEAVAERLRHPEPPPAPMMAQRRSLRGMSPTELVRYFYAAMLSRAARGGLDRRPADTPYEYGARLREQLPEAAEDVDGLTDAYVAAAYAPHPTTPEQARRARGLWQRLRRLLKR